MLKEHDIDATVAADDKSSHSIFTQLKKLQTDFNMNNISPNMIILFDKKRGGFYNPEKTNALYQFVSYEKLFDTH